MKINLDLQILASISSKFIYFVCQIALFVLNCAISCIFKWINMHCRLKAQLILRELIVELYIRVI